MLRIGAKFPAMPSMILQLEDSESDGGNAESSYYYTLLFGKQNSHIIRYNSAFLLHFGWLFPHQGSIVNVRQIVILSVSITLVTILAKISCDNSNLKYCVPLAQNPSIGNNLTLLTLSSLILSFFMNMVIQRWWSCVNCLGAVDGRSYSVMLSVMSMITTTVVNAPKDKQKELKVRNLYSIHPYPLHIFTHCI